MFGGGRHAFSGRLHDVRGGHEVPERGPHLVLETHDLGFNARRAVGLGDPVLILLAAQRARTDHAFAEHLKRTGHHGDFVLLAATLSSASGHLRTAVASRSAGCGCAPECYARHRARRTVPGDQRERAERQHVIVASEMVLWACFDAVSVSARTSSTSRFTLMSSRIELAGLLRMTGRSRWRQFLLPDPERCSCLLRREICLAARGSPCPCRSPSGCPACGRCPSCLGKSLQA